ncbi:MULTISPECIES: hypothetical protein [unclassified Chryseobacterium]|uniref:hypothetical protein n=1 Tax=unclassified Chryseobacterium TaxID=2593645 RepID=UPI00226A1399|nr:MULTISPECIES: hypothetical protein [unclassified Chryseobacterium]
MEKFQKYCLSVLLVIIYNNISAQVTNGVIENEDCRKICEIYSQFFESQHSDSQIYFTKKKTAYQALNQKDKAIEVVGKILPEIQHNLGFNNSDIGLAYSERQKHDLSLLNFEKQSKDYNFTDSTYLKDKVSKIRNKDYLDFKS